MPGEVFERSDGLWGFRITSRSGHVIATDGGQGHETRSAAEQTLTALVSGEYKQGGVYRRADDTWAFRIAAANGRVVATDGGQGFAEKSQARTALKGLLERTLDAVTPVLWTPDDQLDRGGVFSSVRIRNFRSIVDTGELELRPITVLLGHNNTGKSALLHALYLLQAGSQLRMGDRRHGTDEPFTMDCRPSRPRPAQLRTGVPEGVLDQNDLTLHVRSKPGQVSGLEVKVSWSNGQQETDLGQLPATSPNHLIVPVFANRRVNSYESNTRTDAVRQVTASDSGLPSRLMPLQGRTPEGRECIRLMDAVVGVDIGLFAGENNSTVPGQSLGGDRDIELSLMGAGVSAVMAVVTDLARPGPRLYLIEEPETDLHPAALDSLLDELLSAVDAGSQLVVSTHSDHVLRTLGSRRDAIIYETTQTSDPVPTSTYTPVEDAFDRLAALEHLGYPASLPVGWLVFEESSAERFVTELLIPMFTPRLGRLRHVSASGAGNVASFVNDCHRLVLFAHLQDRDTHRVWVLVDGDAAGDEAIKGLKRRFGSWDERHFTQLEADGIEKYYPPEALDGARGLPDTDDREVRMRVKGKLVERVVAWAARQDDGGRARLQATATEVIETLEGIEKHIIEVHGQ